MGRGDNSERRGHRDRRNSASRAFIRRSLLALVAVLYVFSVPWYRDDDAPFEVFLGLPNWVAVAVLCYTGVAVLNGLAWMLTEVDDDGPLPTSLANRPSKADPISGANESGAES